MSDWNPAEIIGFQPNLFSYSLYKHLVTDNVWAIARNKMGYKELKKPKLMYSFTGKPYIDLRMSFNSFLPNNLKSETQKKIINYQKKIPIYSLCFDRYSKTIYLLRG